MLRAFFHPRWPRPVALAVGLAAAVGGFIAGRETGGSPDLRARAGTGTGGPLRLAERPAPTAPSAAAAAWDDEWTELRQGRPASPRRDRALAELLERLARTDPRRALALAAAESNWDLRDDLRDAALRGWGATEPAAAAAWAKTLRLEERFRGMAAVLAGAAEQPGVAVPLALDLCAADPEPAAHYGHTLVSALVARGEFGAATEFAARAKSIDTQTHVLDSAFFQWAQHQPESALAALAQVADPKVRGAALQGVLEGWSAANPRILADWAHALPAGADRAQALATVLPRWVDRDPAGATEWLNRIDPSPELDDGFAAVATSNALIAQHPRSAMDWADSISDPVKRRMAKHDVFYEWAQRDLAAATEFAAAVRNPDEIAMMRQVIDLVKSRG